MNYINEKGLVTLGYMKDDKKRFVVFNLFKEEQKYRKNLKAQNKTKPKNVNDGKVAKRNTASTLLSDL